MIMGEECFRLEACVDSSKFLAGIKESNREALTCNGARRIGVQVCIIQ